jgi:RNA polymerase-binding transcription factor DksA
MKRTDRLRRKKPGRRVARPAASALDLVGVQERINPRWAWHYRVLLSLRESLLAEQREQRAGAACALEPHSMDLADSASDEFDHAMALSELSREQDALFEVEQALARIRSGTYGFCERTGAAIPAARLRAVPWTRFARGAEARMEAEGIIARPKLGPLASVRGDLPGGLEESAPEEEKEIPVPADESLHPIEAAADVGVGRVRRRSRRPQPRQRKKKP